MFKSGQYRTKAAEYGELAKNAANADEGCKYQNLTRRANRPIFAQADQ
jgi:hypothetical protein